MNPQSAGDREIEQEAKRLVAQKGITTIGFVKGKIEDRRAMGDEPNRVYWEKIRKQVELLLLE